MHLKSIGLTCALLLGFTLVIAGQGGEATYKPKRLNKMIELLESGQTVYDISVQGVGYDDGKKLAKERYDLIQYQMEHGPFEPQLLRQFMQGLVDGGPTKSGHRTPTVIVTLPVLGLDEASVKTNHWVIEQVLSAGVHGLMLCHAPLMGLAYLKRGGSEEAHGVEKKPGQLLAPLPEPKLEAARARIMGAMKTAGWAPLHSANIDNITDLIQYGIRVTHGNSVELTNKGRAFTKRQMPY
jgi:hypothetical protein